MCLRKRFWKQLAFGLVDWVKKMTLTNAGGHLSIHWGWNRTKRCRKRESAHCLSWDIYLLLPLDMSAPGSCALGLKEGLTPLIPLFSGLEAWTGITLLAFLGLQLVDGRSPDFWAFIITWANPSFYVSLCFLLVLFLWITLTHTMEESVF